MSFCALEEAFTGPPNPSAPPLKFKKMKRVKGGGGVEGFQSSGVPPALPGAPGSGTGGDVLAGPPPSFPPDESAGGVKMDDLFPLPGDTGGADEWQKAFTLEGSMVPQPQGLRADGSVSVAGKPNLWRQVAAPPVSNGWIAPPTPLQTTSSEPLASIPSELSQRLDVLTRQLESLTTPTHLQGTAELFLFVAIGLLLLLAIDTLLRFAAAAGSAVMRGGGRRGRFGGGRSRLRWY